jgi:hypothetical protein
MEINIEFRTFLTIEVRKWINGREGGYNGFILEDGTILYLVYHREIRGFVSYLETTYKITTIEWEKTHDWIRGIYTESKWFEENANAIRVSEEHSTMELLSTQTPTQKQWKTIKELCESDKLVVSIADIRNRSSEFSVYKHAIYDVPISVGQLATQKVAMIKKALQYIKDHSNITQGEWYKYVNSL